MVGKEKNLKKPPIPREKTPKWAGFQGEFGEKTSKLKKQKKQNPVIPKKTPEIPKDTVTDLDKF